MRKLKDYSDELKVEAGEKVTRHVFTEVLLKKPSLSYEDKLLILSIMVDQMVDDNTVGFVNVSMLTYLLANAELLNGNFRKQICIMRAKSAISKVKSVEEMGKAGYFAFGAVPTTEYKCRYDEVLDGLSSLSLGNLSDYKAVNAVKSRFSNSLTKNRSTAFFNINTSGRKFPNKYPIFRDLFATVVTHGAIPLTEIKKVETLCKYTNPDANWFNISPVYGPLYRDYKNNAIRTNIIAVCGIEKAAYYALVEKNGFLSMLKALLKYSAADTEYVETYAELIAELCVLFVTTAELSSENATNELQKLLAVRLLNI